MKMNLCWVNFLVLFVSASANSFVFVHYHKTGHTLSWKLSHALMEDSCLEKNIHNLVPRRKDITEDATHMRQDALTIFNAPDAVFDWSLFGPAAKVVHFVRDPTDVVISGYLYHSQSPPPKSEDWLWDPELKMCELNPSNRVYVDTITAFASGLISADLNGMIEKVFQLCKDLRHKYKGNTIYDVIKLADGNGTNVFEGMRVEAVRALISVNYGDLIRMTANAVSEARAPTAMTHRIYMSAVTEGEEATFRSTIRNMLQFLNTKDSQVKDCFELEAMVEGAVKAAYVDPKNYVKAQQPAKGGVSVTSHVTQGFLSPALHTHYRQMLLKDPVLGPLLHILHMVLDASSRA